MILIGSQALRLVSPELVQRESKDYDFIATHDDFRKFVKANNFSSVVPQNAGAKMICRSEGRLPVEVEIAWPGTSAEMLLDIVPVITTDIPELNLVDVKVLDLNVLFTIKASHRYKKNSVHFLKTMRDYKAMKAAGAAITDELKPFFKLREKETYTYAHPKLNQGKSSFFNPEEVTYLYEHDTIHLAMAHLDKPAYSYFQSAEVKCERNLFDKLPLQTRLYSVLEESYVLALERSQIPYGGTITPRKSFLIALEKVCTSIASGWWRAFAYDHYDEVLALYTDEYVNTFQKGVDNGVVLLYNKETINNSMAMA